MSRAAAGALAGLALLAAWWWPRRAAAALPPPSGAVAPGPLALPVVGQGAAPASSAWTLPPLEWPTALPSFGGLVERAVNSWAPLGFGPSDSSIGDSLLGQVGGWLPPEPYRTARAPFIDAAHRAEYENGLPVGLLVRLLWQESRFDPAARGSSGDESAGTRALGIAQIIPRWHPGVDPLEPFGAIAYAGRELARLGRRFGNWRNAVMAYHAGETGVARYFAGQAGSGVGPVTIAYANAIVTDAGAA